MTSVATAASGDTSLSVRAMTRAPRQQAYCAASRVCRTSNLSRLNKRLARAGAAREADRRSSLKDESCERDRSALVQCGAFEVLQDGLEMIEAGNLAIQHVAFVALEIGLHLLDRPCEGDAIEFGNRGCDVGKHGQSAGRDFSEPAEHHELFPLVADGDEHDSRPHSGNDRRM